MKDSWLMSAWTIDSSSRASLRMYKFLERERLLALSDVTQCPLKFFFQVFKNITFLRYWLFKWTKQTHKSNKNNEQSKWTKEKNNEIKSEYLSIFGSSGPERVNVKQEKLTGIFFITPLGEIPWTLHLRTYPAFADHIPDVSKCKTTGMPSKIRH